MSPTRRPAPYNARGLVVNEKQVFDDALFDFDFSSKMRAGDTIDVVVEVETQEVLRPGDALTYGAPVTDDEQLVQVRIGGGSAGGEYQIRARVTTTLGDSLEVDGVLRVMD